MVKLDKFFSQLGGTAGSATQNVQQIGRKLAESGANNTFVTTILGFSGIILFIATVITNMIRRSDREEIEEKIKNEKKEGFKVEGFKVEGYKLEGFEGEGGGESGGEGGEGGEDGEDGEGEDEVEVSTFDEIFKFLEGFLNLRDVKLKGLISLIFVTCLLIFLLNIMRPDDGKITWWWGLGWSTNYILLIILFINIFLRNMNDEVFGYFRRELHEKPTKMKNTCVDVGCGYAPAGKQTCDRGVSIN